MSRHIFSVSSAAILCALSCVAIPARALEFSQPQTSLGVFAGTFTNDGWETIILTPGEIEWINSNLYGVSLARDWQTSLKGLRFGIEAQLIQHNGQQDHTEVNLPLFLRYRADSPVIPVQGGSFGLGLSYATEVPEIEVNRKGDSQRLLAHWYAELEFGTPDWAVYPFLRLHHRSDGYVIADFDTGSNAVAVGVRFPF